MPIQTFPIDCGIKLNGHRLTDHNRGAISFAPEKIEQKKRMADGTMRRFWVAEKYSFKVSWNIVPGAASRTVDGFWGKDDLEQFYLDTPEEIVMEITQGDGVVATYTVMFDAFDANLLKRSEYVDFWDMSITLDEV
jgi:hypothetical protein